MENKFCKDCRHLVNRTPGLGFNDPRGDFRCAKSPLLPVSSLILDPVSGAEPYQLASLMRFDEKLCGLEARWFEPSNEQNRPGFGTWGN